MDIKKTLCKECEECKIYIYKNRFKQGRFKNQSYSFKYCEQNKKIVKMGKWTVKYPKEGNTSPIVNTVTKKFFTKYLKTNRKNYIKYINDDHHDLTLKNLAELSKACFIRNIWESSIYPGVTRVNRKVWSATINIGSETIFLGKFRSELRAANAYYQKCEELGMDMNKDTEAYKSFYRRVKKFKYYYKNAGKKVIKKS